MKEKEEIFRIIDSLSDQINGIQQELGQLKNKIEDLQFQAKPVKAVVFEEKSIEKEAVFVNFFEEEKNKKIEQEQIMETVNRLQELTKNSTEKDLEEPKFVEKPPIFQPKTPKIPEPEFSFEKFVSENLKYVGIGVFVLGMVFFMKYAIDNEWISETGRLFIGLATTSVMLGVAHYLRQNFRSFSSVLIGGGIAIAYFSIYWSFQEYQLFSQTTAFVLMLLLTVLTVYLSVIYDRIELAIIAVIGGFGTPFLASTGEGNYIIFFTYLLILNSGMLALAFFKKWNLVKWIAYGLTVILYASWFKKVSFPEEASYFYAFIFATAFYLLFFGMNLIYNLRHKIAFSYSDLGILISNHFFYFTAGYRLVDLWTLGEANGGFTFTIAVFNSFLAIYFYNLAFRELKIDKNLVYLMTGLAVTFASLTVSVQFNGDLILLFWASEIVLLIWLSQKTKLILFQYASQILLAGVIFILLKQNYIFYFQQETETLEINGNYTSHLLKSYFVVFNQGFLSNIFCAFCFFSYYFLLKKEQTETFGFLFTKTLKNRLIILIISLLYLAGLFEINLQRDNFLLNLGFTENLIVLYNLCFLLSLWFLTNYKKWDQALEKIIFAGILLLFSYIFIGYEGVKFLRFDYLSNKISTFLLLFHLLPFTLLIFLNYLIFNYIRNKENLLWLSKTQIFWALAFIFTVHVSLEFETLYVLYRNDLDNLGEVVADARKIGFAVVWGACSLALMLAGFILKIKALRLISLAFFGFTLAKFFVFDFWSISNIGKILIMISLGALLLLVAFLYQKLKLWIFEKE